MRLGARIGLGGGVSQGKHWYVRTSGGSYGAEDGTSYDNAWDGETNVDWTTTGFQPGDTLWICGTHTEAFTIGGNGISGAPLTIRGDYPGDPGIIDSEDVRNTGLDCNSKNYITITGLTSIDALQDCFQFRGTSTGIITNDITATGSGNQGIQHEDSASVTHNNPTCTGNTDDGLSAHGTCVININGGTFSTNADGINVIEDVHLTVRGSTTFSGNTTYDIWVANATTNESAWANITGATLPVGIRASVKGKILLTNCTYSGPTLVADAAGTGYLTASGCTFSGTVAFGADGVSVLSNSIFTSTCAFAALSTTTMTQCLITAYSGLMNGDLNLSKCYVKDNNTINGDLTAEYTLFEGGADHLCDVETGSTSSFKYCVFDGMNTGDFGVAARTGSTVTVNGCTLVGLTTTGKGLFVQVNVTANNCIFTDLESGFHHSAGTAVANNCVFYGNTADTVGTVTENSSQTGDPKLLNVASNDFSLDTGSSAIGNGTDLGASFDEGIDTAAWGDGATEYPVVTTKEQAASWDIGAYIS